MIKMNKYQESLDCIKNTVIDEQADGYYQPRTVEDYCFTDVGRLQELIDNPPLKFEDLKEGMWVWDDKTKSYIYIYKPLDWKPAKGIRYASHIITNSAEGYYMDFEKNRFYRREVK